MSMSVLLGINPRVRSASGFVPNKTCHHEYAMVMITACSGILMPGSPFANTRK